MFRDEIRNHRVQLSSVGVTVTSRALLAYIQVLRILTNMPRISRVVDEEVAWATHDHAIVQEHEKGVCDCPKNRPQPGSVVPIHTWEVKLLSRPNLATFLVFLALVAALLAAFSAPVPFVNLIGLALAFWFGSELLR